MKHYIISDMTVGEVKSFLEDFYEENKFDKNKPQRKINIDVVVVSVEHREWTVKAIIQKFNIDRNEIISTTTSDFLTFLEVICKRGREGRTIPATDWEIVMMNTEIMYELANFEISQLGSMFDPLQHEWMSHLFYRFGVTHLKASADGDDINIFEIQITEKS